MHEILVIKKNSCLIRLTKNLEFIICYNGRNGESAGNKPRITGAQELDFVICTRNVLFFSETARQISLKTIIHNQKKVNIFKHN